MTAGESFRDIFLFDQLALRSDAELIHIITAQHGGRVRVLTARVGVNLGVEHEHLHIGPVLENYLRDILEADITEGAIAANDPDLG